MLGLHRIFNGIIGCSSTFAAFLVRSGKVHAQFKCPTFFSKKARALFSYLSVQIRVDRCVRLARLVGSRANRTAVRQWHSMDY